ncbi:MAG: iron uptake porin [Nostocaceae cyanobacterium]|nr:iron uptake porin [Nostocaceae cyanobacterium]
MNQSKAAGYVLALAAIGCFYAIQAPAQAAEKNKSTLIITEAETSLDVANKADTASELPRSNTDAFTTNNTEDNQASVADLSLVSNQITTSPTTETNQNPVAAETITAETDITTTPTPAAEDSMAQVTSVSQLSDVQPTDWAFLALQSLVERYGCIAGYPDGTFRGNRAMTRYEFAAGVNACLEKISELINTTTSNLVKKEDLVTLQRLQEEFSTELASLRGRVDALEARTAELEANQFSTTTKLFGQAVIGIQGRSGNEADFFPVDGIKDREDTTNNINVISNVQLSLLTQFSPNSILLTGLQAGSGNTGNPVLTNNVRLGYEGDTGNGDLVLSDLTYRHRIGNFAVIAGAAGVNPVNVFRGANRVESAGFGPISRFAQRNPIINIGNGTGGVGFDWQITPRISLQGVYAASTPSDARNGVFGGTNGETVTGAQLVVSPIKQLDIALQYVNAYSPFGRLGTGVGDEIVAVPVFNPATGSSRAPIKTNAFGGTVAWQITPKVTLGGWAGFTTSELSGRSGSVETFNWMAFLNFPDLFGRGNLGGLYVGQPPRITNSDLPVGRNIPDFFASGLGTPGDQPGTTTHVEAFYRFRVSNNISVTPGVVVIFDPANTPASDTITIGAVRTTFAF